MIFNPVPKPKKRKKTKRVNVWNRIRTEIVMPMFEKIGIKKCEISCYLLVNGRITEEQAGNRNWALSFHHRHKRNWYKQFDNEKELLGNYNQVLLLGQYYHDMLEHNKELTEQWFNRLRGID